MLKDLIKAFSVFNSAELSDALDACKLEGALFSIHALAPGTKLIGSAYTIRYTPYEQKPVDFQGAADYIDEVPSHSVIVIDNGGRIDCTTWGEILTEFALLKGIAGTVVHGAVRDAGFIREVKYPVFCKGIYMRSGKNRVYMAEKQGTLNIQGITIKPEDIIFGDDNGVLAIPRNLAEEVLEKAKNIKESEKKIIAAIHKGRSLRQARQDYQYHTPWLKKQD
ncbi:DlpA protein [Legionella londiniensis]|uniref:Putative 4-hydroxy-4-methyl-2-oxoglutarate aldolase n=1 Tax=Legionella londiniensis TaxID=45068 RepID=A0A0W0VP78_9GAMM|nr:RraA family protein [Legionella londiniensis]KTD21973.1 DlpA protein (isocitrate and isopropylmalate dehydrogenase family protein) [Legionella londiniensis]STX94015.1 DlpA protein [Legionella londiniensis]